MSAELGIGKIIESEQHRDAIHVALAPMVAGQDLFPGQHVALSEDSSEAVCDGQKLGIVDPYLSKKVNKGEKFWLFLYPNTVTSLRHEWEHPAFKPVIDTEKLEIEELAEKAGMSYGRLMDAVSQYANYEDYTHMGSNQDYESLSYNDMEKIYKHHEKVNNVQVQPDRFGVNPFTCSC